MKKLPVLLATLALAVALFATVRPATAANGGTWACYVTDKFPDVKGARDWRGASRTEEGLNLVAAGVASGTIITVTYPVKAGMGSQVGAPLVCVKE